MALRSWVTSSLVRHFPQTPAKSVRQIALEGALNEQFSFQVAVRMGNEMPRQVRVVADGPAGWSVRTRRAGYVPVRHHNTPVEEDPLDVDGLGQIPGYVPDPLFDEDSVLLPGCETHAFWMTVKPGRRAEPGTYEIDVRVIPDRGAEKKHTVRIRLHDLRLRRRTGFPITHWFYADALIDWYRTDLFDKRFWEILPSYVQNVVDHGGDMLYVPVFTPPLDGVKSPSQLLRVTRTGKDEYRFDWRDVKRYIALAQKCGIRYFEWCHPITQWGAKHAIRVYENQGWGEKLLWPPNTVAVGKTYRNFLAQYLPKLYRFLTAEKVLNRSFFHISDEPHGEEHLANYKKDRAMLKELAPWMKVMDALTEIEFARQKLTDMPIPSIRTALDFAAEGIPSWCYYCCGPRGKYLNRLMDTPLPKIAMHGFLFYRWPFKGFLHWGYNYWYQSQTRHLIDPFSIQDGLRWPGWAYGDTFEVYPGPDGPIDSIRWEVFGESLQDYALLQTLGVDRDSGIFDPVVSFQDFPKAEQWRRGARTKVLSGNV